MHVNGQDAEPSNAIEAAIVSIHRSLRKSSWDTRGIVAAEWWAHMRQPPHDAHQLHFDLDESSIAQGADKYRLVHPVSIHLPSE